MPLAFDKLIEKRRFSDLSRPQNDSARPDEFGGDNTFSICLDMYGKLSILVS